MVVNFSAPRVDLVLATSKVGESAKENKKKCE